MNKLIFGKANLERIVSCEVSDNHLELFIEKEDGLIESQFKPHNYWILAKNKLDDGFFSLQGDLHYQWMKIYNNQEDFQSDKKKYFKRDIYLCYDAKEAAMLAYGFTYFKGMQIQDVSTLSFDIEATTLEHTTDSKVLLISNTFRKNGQTVRKLFAYDDYSTEAGMFDDWCSWVREVNPSIVLGHNIYSYDFPYLNFCAKKAGTELKLGRDESVIKFNSYFSKFRKDGSQFYEYKNSYIYGREIVDTMFLAIKYDIQRKYESYRLKTIIAQEGKEVAGRQHYDAVKIKDNYLIPEEWTKIKKYAEHDADDALTLYDLMVAPFFYLNQSIPKPFQAIINSASGSQINSFLIRSYLQDGHSIPKADEVGSFEGAISIGNVGVYKNVYKVDVASLYPSIMLEYQVYDKYKDPNGHFLQMLNYYTEKRLEYKRLGKETGDRYYKDLDQASKIIINSTYGMMGAPGLHFNSLINAAKVTRIGREILVKAIEWATGKAYEQKN